MDPSCGIFGALGFEGRVVMSFSKVSWTWGAVLAVVALGAASMTADASSAEQTSQSEARTQWQKEYEAVAGSPRVDILSSGPERTLDLVAAELTLGVDFVVDPLFDVFNGGADISSAAIYADADREITALMLVDVYQNPLTSPDWVFGITGARWKFDTNLDGLEDFHATMFNISGQLRGSVFDPSSNIVCPLFASADASAGGYGVIFDSSCIGNPPRFRWNSEMAYDDISAGIFEVDFAPDSGWVGPMPNAGYAPPPTTPPPTTPPPTTPPPTTPPPTGTGITSLTPARLADTRASGAKVGSPDGSAGAFRMNVFGRGGLPKSGIGAVSLNVTVTDGENPNVGGGYVTVYPCGNRPNASNLNFTAGQTIPNSVIAPVSSSGDVCFYVYGKAHLLVDVSGYFPTGTGITSLTPARLADTRASGAKVGSPDGSAGAFRMNVFGRGGLPKSGIGAVSLNVTVTDGENPNVGGGYVTVYPCGNRPNASNLNFTAGQTIPNSVIAPVSSSGDVCFYVYGKAHLLVDVSGYFPTGTGITSLTPARLADTRASGAKVGSPDGSAGAFRMNVFGRGGLPKSGIGAVSLNVTVTDGENPNVGGGYVTVYPCGNRPNASNLNFTAGQTIPNSVIAPVSSSGDVCFYVYGKAHLLVDVSGYFPK